jgi:hypothetical protein
MVRLARAVAGALVDDVGPEGLLRRLVDPFWFQAFGCLLGFDWHSSGVTTTVCGALKEGLKGAGGALGLVVAGGKGAASRRTPDELRAHGERFGLDASRLIHASRLSAKVDNNALQDGYQLYHHAFFLTRSGSWGRGATGHARRRRHGATVSLAGGRGGQLRLRAARGGLL